MADKSISIKSATDKELDALILRLRKESTVQNLIMDLKRQSTPSDPPDPLDPMGYSKPFDPNKYNVSTEAPIESLYHEEVEATLAHFGIMGMHWGHRRGSSSKQSKSSTKKGPASADYTTARELRSKGSKQLSNKELQAVAQRLQLEKQLRDLNTSDYTKGLDIVKGITGVGMTVASLYALSTTPLGQAVTKGIKNRLNPYRQMSMF